MALDRARPSPPTRLARLRGARLIYVTPSHQHPSLVSMSLERRRALLLSHPGDRVAAHPAAVAVVTAEVRRQKAERRRALGAVERAAAPPAAGVSPSFPSGAGGDVAIIVAPPRGGAAARFGALVVASGVSTARLFRDGIAPAADPAGNARFETSLKREEGRREGSGASLHCGQP